MFSSNLNPRKRVHLGFSWRNAALLAGLVLCAQVQAQSLHLGFIKMDRIIKESTAAASSQKKLEQEFSPREKELATLDASLKVAADKFQLEAPTLAESQRVSRQKSLVEQDRDLQRKRRAFQEDLTARKNEELQKLLASTGQIVKQLAVSEKLDFVFQDAVYVNPKSDITDQVIKGLNALVTK